MRLWVTRRIGTPGTEVQRCTESVNNSCFLEKIAERLHHATKKKQNGGIVEHSTRYFQCPPQGVAPCGALLPFEGTLNTDEDQKIQNSCK